MNMEKNKRRTLLSWLFVVTLLVLCGTLGVLQYRWIGEVSRAERERLRGSLNASLYRLSQDFNGEITLAATTLSSANSPAETRVPEQEYANRYLQWKSTTRHEQLFRRIALAIPQGGTFVLRSLDLDTGTFHNSEWPAGWTRLRDRMNARLTADARRGQPPPPPFGDAEDGLLIEFPRFRRGPGGPPRAWFGQGEPEWTILEVNLDYVRSVLLPEVIHRHLGTAGGLDYQVEVVTRAEPSTVIYRSDPAQTTPIGQKADASVSLFELQFERLPRRAGAGGMREGGRVRGPGWDAGRWQMSVRHHAGSLEALVTRARMRNLAVLGGILVLLLATVAALMRYTRRAQRLADLQMDFVAGVSHELRTPLTVICTAAYNLRRKVANNPLQVERYGALIQQEGEKLTALVEQVLDFASAKAGQAIRGHEPLPVARLIEDSLEASKGVLEQSRCSVEKHIEPDLPALLGDAVALKHAIQNLLSNAAKYGAQGGKWIGISASRTNDKKGSPIIEICVADHGAGIPTDEQAQVFEPFFRGKKAVQDQIHGTGLGLSLVKGIVEAHGGTITVESEPGRGTEFVMRIPAGAAGQPNELTHSVSRG